MQLEGFILLMLTLIIIPVILLSANHNIFFVVTAVVMIAVSLRSIYGIIFNVDLEAEPTDDKMLDELEESVNLDVRKFETGTKVVKNLIAILFFIYCLFYLYNFWLKAATVVIILFWLYSLFNNMTPEAHGTKKRKSVRKLFNILIDISTIVIIVAIAYNKFIKIYF